MPRRRRWDRLSPARRHHRWQSTATPMDSRRARIERRRREATLGATPSVRRSDCATHDVAGVAVIGRAQRGRWAGDVLQPVSRIGVDLGSRPRARPARRITEIRALPVASTVTQNEVDGHATPVSGA